MAQPGSNSKGVLPATVTGNVSYWRVEGSLLELGAMRPVGFFTWNAQSFAERWARRAGMAGMALARPSLISRAARLQRGLCTYYFAGSAAIAWISSAKSTFTMF